MYLILSILDALCKCLEKDQLQVAFGGSYEGDGVIVPGRPLKMGLTTASLQQHLGGGHYQTCRPLPVEKSLVSQVLSECLWEL